MSQIDELLKTLRTAALDVHSPLRDKAEGNVVEINGEPLAAPDPYLARSVADRLEKTAAALRAGCPPRAPSACRGALLSARGNAIRAVAEAARESARAVQDIQSAREYAKDSAPARFARARAKAATYAALDAAKVAIDAIDAESMWSKSMWSRDDEGKLVDAAKAAIDAAKAAIDAAKESDDDDNE